MGYMDLVGCPVPLEIMDRLVQFGGVQTVQDIHTHAHPGIGGIGLLLLPPGGRDGQSWGLLPRRLPLDEWRRNNVTMLISNVHSQIQVWAAGFLSSAFFHL